MNIYLQWYWFTNLSLILLFLLLCQHILKESQPVVKSVAVFLLSMVTFLSLRFSLLVLTYLKIFNIEIFLENLSKILNFFFIIFHHQILKFSQKIFVIVDKSLRGKNSFEKIAIHCLVYWIFSQYFNNYLKGIEKVLPLWFLEK